MWATFPSGNLSPPKRVLLTDRWQPSQPICADEDAFQPNVNDLPLSDLVNAARAGDQRGDAYAEIVQRFEGMARTLGLRWLGDPQRAEDVAQEAFIEAYYSLDQLREPEAFAGWFRRIVLKHCDRHLRRDRREQPLNAWQHLADGAHDGAHDALDTMFLRDRIRQAFDQLSERQRTLMRMFYWEGYAQHEIVELLQWPLSTVKKQLFMARKILREEMSDMAQTENQTPSRDLPLRVRFFLALRARDVNEVRALAQAHRELLDARTEWAELDNSNYWPLGYTALHYAVAVGDRSLVDALIRVGADVNALTKSQFATPLHVAVMQQRADMLSVLIDAGANIGAANTNGMTALHFAAHRGVLDAVNVLLAAGAAHSLKDAAGHTPLDWAEHRANQSVVDALRAKGAQTAAPKAQAIPIEDRSPTILETGIKVIDLFAPIQRGAINTLFTPLTGVGKVVQLEQCIDTVQRHYQGVNYFLGVEHRRYTGRDFALELNEVGLENAVSLHFAAYGDVPALRNAVDAVVTALDPKRETLILADAHYAEDADLRTTLEGVAKGTVTMLWFGEHSAGAEPEIFAGAKSLITFDMWRALNGYWPAIDPLRSQSSTLSGRHAELVARAKRLLRRYEDLRLIVERDPRGVDAFELEADRVSVARARRLHAYLAQPFPITELFTNTYGEHVPLVWALDGLEAVLDGRADDASETDLRSIANTRRYIRR